MPSPTKRDQIRQAAEHCFRDHGYHATSVDMICAAASVSKGSYYWHFSSKQEVFIEIIDAWTRDVSSQLYDQFEEAGRSDDYRARITLGLLRETRRSRALVPLWVEFTALAAREPEVKEAMSRFHKRIRLALTELLRPIFRDQLSEEELSAVAATSFGAYSGLIIQELCDPDDANAKSAMRRFMSALGAWTDTRDFRGSSE